MYIHVHVISCNNALRSCPCSALIINVLSLAREGGGGGGGGGGFG